MKKIRKIAALLFALAVFASVIPVSDVLAADVKTAPNIVWTAGADGWQYLQGTNIRAKQDGDMLTIDGTGELPDFDYWYLYQRPWNGTTCQYLTIGAGITYVGSYAFYNLSSIKYIFMSTSTFINDTTVFEGIAYMPIFRIYSATETSRQFGTISLTSYDSIKRMAQSNWNGACYILDTEPLATSFQNSTNPTIINVYNGKDADAPWNSVADNGNGGKTTNICKITSTGISSSCGVSAQQKYQGNACYEVYSAFKGDYNFATTFNITLYNGGDVVYTTDTEYQYTLTIPKEYRIGTTYKLIGIGSGTVYTYDDLDSAYDTITFKTDKPTTSYALIYQ